jgi:hypothetical protein
MHLNNYVTWQHFLHGIVCAVQCFRVHNNADTFLFIPFGVSKETG